VAGGLVELIFMGVRAIMDEWMSEGGVFFSWLFFCFCFLELVCWEGDDIMIGFVFGFRINQDGIEFYFVIVLSFFPSFFLSFCFLLFRLNGTGRNGY